MLVNLKMVDAYLGKTNKDRLLKSQKILLDKKSTKIRFDNFLKVT